MRSVFSVVFAGLLLSFALGAVQAQAAGSCSIFATITSFDAEAKTIEVKADKRMKQSKFFPKTEGAPTVSKIPAKCKSKTMRQGKYAVKTTGGRMSITQIRENYSGKMLNDIEDETWVPKKLQELLDAKTVVSVILRQPPGKGPTVPFEVTTLNMPVTEAELAEIERLNSQVTDE
jgi:hypothetical protein